MKSSIIFKIAVIVGISLAQSGYGDTLQKSLTIHKTNTDSLTVKQYITLIAAHVGGTLALVVGIGIGVGAALLTEQAIKPLPNNNPAKVPLAIAGVSTMITSIAAGLYVFYKTPQWTDTYILKSDKIHMPRQHLINQFIRAVVTYPIGGVVGEYLK